MLVGFSSIITLFNLILIGIKNINDSSEKSHVIIERKAVSVRQRLEEIWQLSKVIFDVIDRYDEHTLSGDEMKSISLSHLDRIEIVLNEMYRFDLAPMLNLFSRDLTQRIQELLGSKSQRESRLRWIITVIEQRDINRQNNKIDYLPQGKMIMEAIETIIKKYTEFLHERLNIVE